MWYGVENAGRYCQYVLGKPISIYLSLSRESGLFLDVSQDIPDGQLLTSHCV